MAIQTAVRASDVDHALGANSDLNNGNWTSITEMISQSKYAGIDILRADVPTASFGSAYYANLEQIAAAGLKLDLVVDTADTPANNVAALAAFLQRHPSSIAFVEGPNEPNNWGVSYAGKTGVDGAKAWLADFFAAMNANPATAAVTVAGMSSWPAVAAASDANNLHIYPDHGDQPGTYIAQGLGAQNAVDPNKPFVITELGWYTAPGLGDPNSAWSGVDEATQAKLVLNAYMDAVKAGAIAVDFYELRDWVFTDVAAHFGLFHSDDTPKLAATALHNLQGILADTGSKARSFAPGALDITVTGPGDISTKLMQKSSGEFVLAVWREPDIWDEAAQHALSPAGEAVSLHLGAKANAALYDPITGGTAVKSAKAINDFALTVTDHPVFVSLTSTPSAPQPVVVGSGAHSLLLKISEDAWNGNAQYSVKVDGQQIGGTLTALASHAAGKSELISVKGDWAAGNHVLTVTFLNDGYGGTAATDRNLYVDAVSYDGTALVPGSAALFSSGPANFNFASGVTKVLGSGAHSLLLKISEDAWNGNAQYSVKVDGQQIGGTLTALASHAAGKSELISVKGDWAAGNHVLTVTFLNDGYGGTAATDRNLYVDAVSHDGTALVPGSAALFSSGPADFIFAS